MTGCAWCTRGGPLSPCDEIVNPWRDERFSARVPVREVGQCWLWVGARNDHGYGQAWVRRRIVYVHRLALEWKLGEHLGARLARHSCDNPPCCNPDHLAPGTSADNVRDMYDRGRAPRPQHGSASPRAKLTESVVAEALERLRSGATIASVARSLGVSASTISRIRTGEMWPHMHGGVL